jgi:hypothetical protein
MATDPPNFQAPAQPGPVHRLTFAYEGDQIRLVGDQVVRMVVPPTRGLDEAGTLAGFSVILRDANNRPLYHFVRTSPMRHDAEVFATDPSRTLHRVDVQEPRGTFTVLVPHVDGAASVELAGHARASDANVSEPRVLAKFPLATPRTGE